VARRPSPTLTDAETRLMNVLWDKGEATVADVVAGLPKPAVAYNTVQTILNILEGKGYVTHARDGRAFVYRPKIERAAAQRRAVGHLLSSLFGGSPSALVLNVLEDERLDPREVRRLKKLIEDAR
jgi:predicted transcriptional regulator